MYGITKEQYDAIDLGHCPVCERVWSDRVRPVVDHDHVTSEVRGILCFYCNHRLVGRHRDADLIQRVADYLRSPRPGYLVPPKRKTRKSQRREKI